MKCAGGRAAASDVGFLKTVMNLLRQKVRRWLIEGIRFLVLAASLSCIAGFCSWLRLEVANAGACSGSSLAQFDLEAVLISWTWSISESAETSKSAARPMLCPRWSLLYRHRQCCQLSAWCFQNCWHRAGWARSASSGTKAPPLIGHGASISVLGRSEYSFCFSARLWRLLFHSLSLRQFGLSRLPSLPPEICWGVPRASSCHFWFWVVIILFLVSICLHYFKGFAIKIFQKGNNHNYSKIPMTWWTSWILHFVG